MFKRPCLKCFKVLVVYLFHSNYVCSSVLSSDDFDLVLLLMIWEKNSRSLNCVYLSVTFCLPHDIEIGRRDLARDLAVFGRTNPTASARPSWHLAGRYQSCEGQPAGPSRIARDTSHGKHYQTKLRHWTECVKYTTDYEFYGLAQDCGNSNALAMIYVLLV